MARVRWIEASLFAHEEVALGLLVVDGDALLASNDISIFNIDSKEVLKLTFTVELSGSILPDKEETWFRDCLWWWKELAFLFDVLSILNARRVWLFVINTLDHLVQVERDTKLLS